jgi:diacylglycerol kinase (ATP)
MEESPFKGRDRPAPTAQCSRYSYEGLAAAFRNEDAFRQEVFAACVLIPLALWLGNSGTERALMSCSVFLVLIVELLNSSLEATVDRISLEHHPLAKRAKDIGSAAVMIALTNALLVWALILVQRF